MNSAESIYKRYLLSGDHEVLFPHDVRIQMPAKFVPSSTELLHMFETPKKYVKQTDAVTSFLVWNRIYTQPFCKIMPSAT